MAVPGVVVIVRVIGTIAEDSRNWELPFCPLTFAMARISITRQPMKIFLRLFSLFVNQLS